MKNQHPPGAARSRKSRPVVLVDNIPRSTAIEDPEWTPSFGLYQAMVRTVLTELDTPFSLGVMLLLDAEEWTALASLAVSPLDYLDTPSGVRRYARDAQAAALVKKFSNLPSQIDRDKKAIEDFHASESLCGATNNRLILIRHEGPLAPVEHAWTRIVSRAKRWMCRMLGPLPDVLGFGFGPGTAVGLESSTLVDKLTTCGTITSSAATYLPHLASWSKWEWRRQLSGLTPTITNYGEFFTVPKSAVSYRNCEKQPLYNLGFQLAIGRHMKARLANVQLYTRGSQGRIPALDGPGRVTFDSPLGEQRHREWALRGSIDGSYATIDLSSASDTVCTEIVRALLPDEWYELLNDLRTHHTKLPNQETLHANQKFSAMGCGFTFELETAIFAALIHGVTGLRPGTDFLVYGDDIIVPHQHSRDVIAVLRYAGFIPNVQKSFTTGLFRESCGGDFYCGYDVRPIFVKSLPSLSAWYDLANSLAERGYHNSARWCVLQLPLQLRRFGPFTGVTFRGGFVPRPAKVSGWNYLPGPARISSRDGMRWVQGVVESTGSYSWSRFGVPSWHYKSYAVELGASPDVVVPRRMPFVEYRNVWLRWM